MQTPAEKDLIKRIIAFLKESKALGVQKILNVGAGKSVMVETGIINKGRQFVCDRVDIVDCKAEYPFVGKSLISSIESAPQLNSGYYGLVFANYVLEHISDLDKASKEINRILKPSGIFIASISNPSAPEFMLSKYTPLWFHRRLAGCEKNETVHETHYAYKNIKELINIFERNNFQFVEAKYYAITNVYLYRLPVLNTLSAIYDRLVSYFKVKFLMGNVYIVFKKGI